MKSVKNIISFRLACRLLTYIFLAIILFHTCALIGLIPMDIVWGGRLKTHQEFVVFELLSLILNLIMLTVVQLKSGRLKIKINRVIIQAALWVMVVLFAINTVGNLVAVELTETLIFTPITLFLSFLSLRLVVE